MSEQPPEGLALPQQDAGAAFRAEMAIANFFLGYWRHMVAALGAVLLGALVYGQYASWYKNGQLETTSEIADVRARLPTVLLSPYPSPEGLTEAQRNAAITGGDKLVSIGAAARGTAAVEAYLNAAELFRQAGDATRQRQALQAAEPLAKGALAYAVVGALSNLDLEEGKGEEAVRRLEAFRKSEQGMLAEQATLDLGLAYESLSRGGDAQLVYNEFVSRWPDSVRAEQARQRLARLSGAGS